MLIIYHCTISSLKPRMNDNEYTGEAVDKIAQNSPTHVNKEEEISHASRINDPELDQITPGIFRTVVAMVGTIIPAGGLLFSVLSIASTSIGAGILGLPDAFKSTGSIMSFVYLILITAESVYSMYVLVKVAEKTGLRSFEEMTSALLCAPSLYFVAALRWLYCIGAMVSYVVTIGNLLNPILQKSNAPSFWQGSIGSKLIQGLLWLVFFLPLCIPQEISSLRYMSAVGLLMMLYFSSCVMAHYGIDSDNRPPTRLITTGNDAVKGLGVFIFSYMCQINGLEIFFEMSRRSPARFAFCCIISLSFCGMLYGLTGIFGYLNFGDALDGSILLQFNPIADAYIMISFVGVFIKVCASYGLHNNAACSCLYQAFRWRPDHVSFWKHFLVAIPLAVFSMALGIFIPNVNTVFGFTGGVCGGFIAFILPALFYMYAGDWSVSTVGWMNYIATYLMLLAGVVAVVFGTAATVYSVFA